jgi:hypothetical protein
MRPSWDIEFKDRFKNICMLHPIYKKTTAYSETCKRCKVRGCNRKSEPDPSVDGASNMCRFHFTWYNGMCNFYYAYEKMKFTSSTKSITNHNIA